MGYMRATIPAHIYDPSTLRLQNPCGYKILKQNKVQQKTLEHFLLNIYTYLTERKSNNECTVYLGIT